MSFSISSWPEFLKLQESRNPEVVFNAVQSISNKLGEQPSIGLVERVFAVDPTPNKAYVNWMLKKAFRGYNSTKDFLDDLESVESLFAEYENVKVQIPVEYRDINKLSSFKDIQGIIERYGQQSKRKKLGRSLPKNEYVEIFQNKDWAIIIPLTEAAAKYWGSGTTWCFSIENQDTNQFDKYNKIAPIVIFRSNEVSQPFGDGKNYRTESAALYFGDMDLMNPEFKNGINIEGNPSAFFENNIAIRDAFFGWLSNEKNYIWFSSRSSVDPIEVLETRNYWPYMRMMFRKYGCYPNTGTMELNNSWLRRISREGLLSAIDEIDYHTVDSIIDELLEADYPIPWNSVIYHMLFDQGTNNADSLTVYNTKRLFDKYHPPINDLGDGDCTLLDRIFKTHGGNFYKTNSSSLNLFYGLYPAVQLLIEYGALFSGPKLSNNIHQPSATDISKRDVAILKMLKILFIEDNYDLFKMVANAGIAADVKSSISKFLVDCGTPARRYLDILG